MSRTCRCSGVSIGSSLPTPSVPAVKPQLESPLQLADFVGIYYSDELYTDYKLSLEGSTLTLWITETFKVPLTPASSDSFTFAGGQGKLSFKRDASGKITGFVFDSTIGGRDVKGIAFKKQ